MFLSSGTISISLILRKAILFHLLISLINESADKKIAITIWILRMQQSFAINRAKCSVLTPVYHKGLFNGIWIVFALTITQYIQRVAGLWESLTDYNVEGSNAIKIYSPGFDWLYNSSIVLNVISLISCDVKSLFVTTGRAGLYFSRYWQLELCYNYSAPLPVNGKLFVHDVTLVVKLTSS